MNHHVNVFARIFVSITFTVATFFGVFPVAYAGGTLSIGALTPGSVVYVGDTVAFTANAAGFTSPSFSIEDNFGGTSISNGNISISGNFSWIPSTGDIGTHSIVVTAVDALGNNANVTQYITVNSPVVTLSTPSPGAIVSAGVAVTFTTSVTGLTNPVYTMKDSFGGGTVTSGNINSAGTFTWTPTLQDVGNHTITITASDSLGRTKSASQVITVPVSVPFVATIQSLTPGAVVSPGQTVSFSILTTGAVTPIYTISDAFFPTSLTTNSINTSGIFSWTPNMNETGAHRVTVYVTDATGRSVAVPVTITVQSAIATIQALSPGSSVYFGNSLSFNVIMTGFNNPTFTLSDTFSGTSVTNANIDSSGRFLWKATSADIGTHTITVFASDTYGHNASSSQSVIVTASPVVSILALSPGHLVTIGSSVTFTATTSGLGTSVYALTDTFSGSSLRNTNIHTGGNFSWTPVLTDVGTHQISVYATESSGRSVSTTTSLIVTTDVREGNTSVQGNVGTLVTPIFLNSLALGSSGGEVIALQNILAKMGYLTATPNGYFGFQTQSAVKRFQTARGLEPVGFVGRQTRTVLNQSSEKAPTSTSSSTVARSGHKFMVSIRLGSKGIDVTELQKILTSKGLYDGPISGYFGVLTEAAVKKFQGIRGFEQSGNVGPATRGALNIES